jgi:hypothetical protein
MTKQRWLLFVFVALLAVSCGRVRFDNVDLNHIVYQEGDLPAGGGSMELQKVDAVQDWEYDQWVNGQVFDDRAGILLDVNVVLFTGKKERNKAFDGFSSRGGQE